MFDYFFNQTLTADQCLIIFFLKIIDPADQLFEKNIPAILIKIVCFMLIAFRSKHKLLCLDAEPRAIDESLSVGRCVAS